MEDDETLEQVIYRSLCIKKAVVEEDEKESGLRRILNFGHTLGHGIESESGLGGLYHGECVGLGMIPMCSKTVRARLLPTLERLRLPTVVEGDLEKILSLAAHDKKRSGDQISVVFVDEIGSFRMEKMPLETWNGLIRDALMAKETEV